MHGSAARSGRGSNRARRLAGLLLGLGLGPACEPPPAGAPPTVSLTLNALPGDMSALVVTPPSGFVINVAFTAGSDALRPETTSAVAVRWGTAITQDLSAALVVSPGGAVGVVPSSTPLSPGTWTLLASVYDTAGRQGSAQLHFAVREFSGGAPPIGLTQQIWLDFDVDRDATPGPDFDVDLQAFGLGSAASPTLSAEVRARVIQAVLLRLYGAYYFQNPNALPGFDPIFVGFTTGDPGSGDVTRVCVGGEDPSGGSTMGSILYDPGNANRSSVECSSIPPTGIFPRELLYFAGDATFASTFNGLRPATGGTPAGAHVLDPVVLAPGFSPTGAPADQQARHTAIASAIGVLGNLLGSLTAHEIGHALGLVPPGAPGVGLYGGNGGGSYVHDEKVGGGTPSENFLMNPGSAFDFSKLAGLNGHPLPYFRPIDFAYLRDRAVLASNVTSLLMPPVPQSVAPSLVDHSYQQIFITGSSFAAPSSVRCRNATYEYDAIGETVLSSTQLRFSVIQAQIPPGVYDVEVTGPDGQTGLLPAALTVQ